LARNILEKVKGMLRKQHDNEFPYYMGEYPALGNAKIRFTDPMRHRANMLYGPNSDPTPRVYDWEAML
jgi:hypothetical protein